MRKGRLSCGKEVYILGDLFVEKGVDSGRKGGEWSDRVAYCCETGGGGYSGREG